MDHDTNPLYLLRGERIDPTHAQRRHRRSPIHPSESIIRYLPSLVDTRGHQAGEPEEVTPSQEQLALTLAKQFVTHRI